MTRVAVSLACAAALAAPVSAARELQRLAIYYGYPSLVDGAAGDLARAAAVFSRYDVVVFGDGLELGGTSSDPGLRAEHDRLRALLPRLHARTPRPSVYGYIDLGRTQQLALAEIERRIAAWAKLGVDGIFFDEAGVDFGVTAARRRAAVAAVHARTLSAFMNAFNPDDLFDAAAATSLPGGGGPAAGDLGARDAVLIESFAVRIGVVQPRDVVARRVDAAKKWRERTGVKLFGVTTAAAGRFDAAAFDYAASLAGDLGLDGFGWGEPNFSADTKLPARPR